MGKDKNFCPHYGKNTLTNLAGSRRLVNFAHHSVNITIMRHLLLLCFFALIAHHASAQLSSHPAYSTLPREVSSGPQDKFHVQGIAFDARNQCFYMSFTTSLIKVDLQGRVVGSVVGLTGHLGCMAMNPDDGRLYASNEYKHDAIGQGISKGLNQQNDDATGFYVSIFDVDRINRLQMDASEVMTTVYIREAVDDYQATVTSQGHQFQHRHGCSGIDGLTIAPAWGKKKGRNMLYVAYGVYSEKERTDNDYQVILCYDISKWKQYEKPLSAADLHQSGPKAPTRKYFVYTGNTNWGIQNLAYDPTSGHMYAAVYPGQKEGWPNYSFFAIDGGQKPKKQKLTGFDQPTKGYVLSLLPQGMKDTQHGTWGWKFPWGSTGICPIGDGYAYISHNSIEQGKQATTLHLYRWTGKTDSPFELVP